MTVTATATAGNKSSASVPRPVLGFGRGAKADGMAAGSSPASVGVAAKSAVGGTGAAAAAPPLPSAAPAAGVPTPSDEVAPLKGAWGKPNNIRRHAESDARPPGDSGVEVGIRSLQCLFGSVLRVSLGVSLLEQLSSLQAAGATEP